jgi:hypothetical protein
MFFRSSIILTATMLAAHIVCAQTSVGEMDDAYITTTFSSTKFLQTDSGVIITTISKTACKKYITTSSFIASEGEQLVYVASKPKQAVAIYKPALLTINGDVSYDFFYRSKIDTPINQQNFQQHTERINLDILIKEKYPLKISFAARQSNSPYFRNFIDANFNFDRFTFNKNIKQQLLDKLNAQIPAYKYPDLSNIEATIKQQVKEYTAKKEWLEDPLTLQKIVEEREKIYYKKLKEKEDSLNQALRNTFEDKNTSANIGKVKATGDSITANIERLKASKDKLTASLKSKADSIVYPYAKLYEAKKQELDSLSKKIDDSRKKADSIKNNLQKDIAGIQRKIYNATSEKALQKIASENGINIGTKDKWEKRLSAIKTLGIGRSMVNYTELTAQNITVTGVNIEYNPSVYIAFAAGKIDYRFREFYNKNAQSNNQYLVMGRLGFGDKDKAAVIFSLFEGRKNTSQFSLSDSVKNYVNIMGYSVETIYKKDENTSISAEFAKSTKPVTGSLQANKQTGALFAFDDQTNIGINIKAQTKITETNTKLSGFYRKTGENFQSFSLFSYNTDQTAWLARVDQTFMKNKITLTGMLRRNDFTNPFVEKTYKTSTTFKSILVNVRFPKYPSLSVGYYPGTQLYSIDNETIRESAYYILNGTVTYNYFYKNIGMNSSFVYNKYTSQASDSGFVAYKGVNYYASQTAFFKKLQLQAGFSYSKQPELEYNTLETSADYALRNWLKVGVGAKYNAVNGGDNYWGKRLQLSADFKQLGSIQFQYEKSFLPTIYQSLYPVEIGRVSWYKYF